MCLRHSGDDGRQGRLLGQAILLGHLPTETVEADVFLRLRVVVASFVFLD